MLDAVVVTVSLVASLCAIVSFVQANRLHVPLRAAIVVAGWMLAMTAATCLFAFVLISGGGLLLESRLNGTSDTGCFLTGALRPPQCDAHDAYLARLTSVAIKLGGAVGLVWATVAVSTDRESVRKIWRRYSEPPPSSAEPGQPVPPRQVE